MAGNLTAQVRNIAEMATPSPAATSPARSPSTSAARSSQLKDTLNTMVDQLNAFASEVTRVAREVGTEGRLGGQAQVPGVAGTSKGLTDNVNIMASNLTRPVAQHHRVTTASPAATSRRMSPR